MWYCDRDFSDEHDDHYENSLEFINTDNGRGINNRDGLISNTSVDLENAESPIISKEMSTEDAMRVMDVVDRKYDKYMHSDEFREDLQNRIDNSGDYHKICFINVVRTCGNADILLEKISQCRCCERHTINRPTNLIDVSWVHNCEPCSKERQYSLYSNIHYNCDCPCRNRARTIQRNIKNLIIG